MAVREIVQLGYPTLTKRSDEVRDVTDTNVRKVIEDLLDTVKDAGGNAAGLAANQIGELYRITVIQRVDKQTNDWEVLINPRILKKSSELSTIWEGCLSIGNGNLFGQVTRPRMVEVEYFDQNGNPKKISASDFFSHLIQHEIDHLDGKLFTQYLEDPTKLFTSEELDEFEKNKSTSFNI
jgi:peptide deformylase